MVAWILPALSLVVGIAGGVIGAWIGLRVGLAEHAVRLRYIEQELGDSESGLRGWRHYWQNKLPVMVEDIATLKRWKERFDGPPTHSSVSRSKLQPGSPERSLDRPPDD